MNDLIMRCRVGHISSEATRGRHRRRVDTDAASSTNLGIADDFSGWLNANVWLVECKYCVVIFIFHHALSKTFLCAYWLVPRHVEKVRVLLNTGLFTLQFIRKILAPSLR